MKLNQSVLQRLLAWGEPIPGFKPAHAVDGLTVVQGYLQGVDDPRGGRIEGLGMRDEDSLFLVALDLTWTFWQDDCFDGALLSSSEPVDLAAALRALTEPPSTPAGIGLFHLRKRFAEAARSPDDYQLFLDTAAAVLRAWHVEERWARESTTPSYTAYMENGIDSTTIPHVLAAISLVYGLDMPARLSNPPFQGLIRHLALSSRLQNDLLGIERDRREGSPANAVLITERFMTAQLAHGFVADQRLAHERLLAQHSRELGVDDPFARLALAMLASQEQFYLTPRERYSPV